MNPDAASSALLISKGVASLMDDARSLARQARRGIITTSCLLFAFARTTEMQDDVGWLLRAEMDQSGRFDRSFEEFLSDDNVPSEDYVVPGIPGRFTANTSRLFFKSAEFATQVSGYPEIHRRHLLAALLCSGTPDGGPDALYRLRTLDLDIKQLKHKLLDFILKAAPEDDAPQWEMLLDGTSTRRQSIPTDLSEVMVHGNFSGQDRSSESLEEHPKITSTHAEKIGAKSSALPAEREAFVPGPPRYSPEFCGIGGSNSVTDHLGVADYAHRLAELLILRETTLPLAIGLFGNWGSGKSHFMNLMDRHMKELAGEARLDESRRTTATRNSPWCENLVHVYFNAWHYSDSNLWASLVSEVFDALFLHLKPKQDELTILRKRLQDARGISALAMQEDIAARHDADRARREYQEACQELESAREFMSGLYDGLRTLIPEVMTEQNRTKLEELLGVSADVATLSELSKRRSDLKTVSGKATALWRKATAVEGRLVRIGYMVGALIVLVLFRFLAARIPDVKQILVRVGPVIQVVLASCVAILTTLLPVYAQLKKGLATLEGWQTRAERAQQSYRTGPLEPKLFRTLQDAETRAAAAQVSLRLAVEKEAKATDALNEQAPQRRLACFIEARALSTDYRGQLGLISLARRDFKALSELFADSDLFDPGTRALTEGQELAQLRSGVDRIILFIDDLDRCDPEKVVDVLQAVHLLLAFPLFGVVVGVDQRCLKHSLLARFSGFLADIDMKVTAGASLDAQSGAPATPLDYLEKIFHIPFQLPPMDGVGFAHLMDHLIGEPARLLGEESRIEWNGPPLPESTTSFLSNLERELVGTDRSGQSTFPPPSDLIDDVHEPTDLRFVGSVPLEQWEKDAVKQYHALMATPRGAIRFLNTYRVVRSCLLETEWDDFRPREAGPEEYRLAMLFLAAAAGQPAHARNWFIAIRDLCEGHSSHAWPLEGENGTSWSTFRGMFASLYSGQGDPSLPARVGKWISRVERFAF